jgi:hypothetical protein
LNILCIKQCPLQIEQGTLWHTYPTATAVETARSITVIGQTGVLLQGPLRSTLAPQRTAKEAALISTFLGIAAAVAKTGGPFVGRVVISNWILILHTFFTLSWQERFLYLWYTVILFIAESAFKDSDT